MSKVLDEVMKEYAQAIRDWCTKKEDEMNGVKSKKAHLGTCVIPGCGKDAVVVYPFLSGEPRFCSEHYNERDAGPYGCDFSEPDDFDIPG